MDDFADVIEELDGVAEHVAAVIDDAMDFFCGDFAVCEIDCGFDAGEGEAFDAVSKKFEILHLGFVEFGFDGVGVVEIGEDFAVALVVFFEEIFVVPEGVVCVEADGGDSPVHGWGG